MLSKNEPFLFRVAVFPGHLIIVANEKISDDTEKRITINSVEAPHQDFLDALAALEPHIRNILELPSEWARGRTTVIGAGFSRHKETDEAGWIMAAQVALKTSCTPFLFTTPFMSFRELPLDTIKALDRLRREAVAFINGKRAETDD